MHKLTRALELGIGCLFGCALLDPVRVIADLLRLREARERHPEMFDSATALANADGALEDALALERVAQLRNTATACLHLHQAGELRLAPNGYRRWLVCDDCHVLVRELEPVVCEHARFAA